MTTAKKPWMSSLGQTFLLVGGWMSGIHPKKVTDVEIWIAQGPQMAPQHSQFWQTVVLGSSGAAGECWRVRDGHIPNKIHLVHGIHTYNHIIIYIYIYIPELHTGIHDTYITVCSICTDMTDTVYDTYAHTQPHTNTHTTHTYTHPTERESRFYMFVLVQNIARLYLKSLQAKLQVDVYEQIQKNTSNSNKTKLRRNSFAVNCTQARNHMADVASHRLGRAPVNQARRKLLMDIGPVFSRGAIWFHFLFHGCHLQIPGSSKTLRDVASPWSTNPFEKITTSKDSTIFTQVWFLIQRLCHFTGKSVPLIVAGYP